MEGREVGEGGRRGIGGGSSFFSVTQLYNAILPSRDLIQNLLVILLYVLFISPLSTLAVDHLLTFDIDERKSMKTR